jgi:hypothetical protein
LTLLLQELPFAEIMQASFEKVTFAPKISVNEFQPSHF